ncbi:MAG: hypothetical protein RLZZ399_816 [Verrucomicrobiota bacterium]|jgi:small subunit ribosomal protein S17
MNTVEKSLSRGNRKLKVGEVTSLSGTKSIVVESTTRVPHGKFGKIVKQVKRFHAHDESGVAKVGDTVEIAECRPLSKLKRWRLVSVISK